VLSLLKQYRELVVTGVLIALPFATYLSHAKHGKNLNPFDRAVLTVTGPLERGLNTVVYSAIDTWGSYVGLRHVRAQNLTLRAKVLELEAQNGKLQEAKLENERLRQLLDFARQVPAPSVVAQVVGTGLAPDFLSIRIGRGAADGLRKGMAVVTPRGVVGKIQQVTAHQADVELITDASSAVAVESQKSRARATVRGSGDAHLCKLDYAERSALFEDGDLLITAGTDGIFPKGLAVGRVSHLDHQKAGFSLRGEVTLAVDLSTVEEVLVLGEAGDGAPAQARNGALLEAVHAGAPLRLLSAGVTP